MKNWSRITIETSDDGGKNYLGSTILHHAAELCKLQKTPAKSEQVFVGVPTRIVSVNAP